MRLQTRNPLTQATLYSSDVSVICFHLGRKRFLALFELNPGDGSWSVFVSAIQIVQAWLPFHERDHVIAKRRAFDFGAVFHKADKVFQTGVATSGCWIFSARTEL